MKYIVKFFVVTFLLLVSTHASADKIVYLDMKFVLNNSKAGKGAQDYLQKTFKDLYALNLKKYNHEIPLIRMHGEIRSRFSTQFLKKNRNWLR